MARQMITTVMSVLLLLCPSLANAQEEKGTEATAGTGQWYIGLEGGVPFGVSTFSSFGADKVRAGYAFGLSGGYRFNPVLSAELALKWGKASLSARDCCAGAGYWLGADGITYHSAVPGVNGYGYAALKSDVSLQQYGVRLNVNLLGLFAATRQSRWTLEVSPVLAAVGTTATVKAIAGGADVLHGNTEWHLGAGGNLQAGYALTKSLRLGVYSGITWLTGKGMDGIKEHLHDANFLWESGVRIGWTFGKCNRKGKNNVPDVSAISPGPAREVCPERTESPAVIVDERTDRNNIRQRTDSLPDKAETEIITVESKEEAPLAFPTVYFGFNRTDIAASEKAKLQAIYDTLRAYPDVQITVTGWCDNVGSRAVNNLISHRRAEAVKAWLVRQGIKVERIRTQGMGIDRDEADRSKARRAVIEEQGKEVEP